MSNWTKLEDGLPEFGREVFLHSFYPKELNVPREDHFINVGYFTSNSMVRVYGEKYPLKFKEETRIDSWHPLIYPEWVDMKEVSDKTREHY